jgi:hypothetical protein
MTAKIPRERVGEIMKIVLTELKNAGWPSQAEGLA